MKSSVKKFFDFFRTPGWLFAFLSVVLVLRIPSFFEPYSYGDEMIYLTLGNAIRKGVTLYKGIHDNKPPLLYIMAAIAGNLFWFKVILALWSLVTIFLFWKLAKVLFEKNDKLQKISTIIFGLLTTLPLLEGNIVNSEVFMIGPTILAFYILLSRKKSFGSVYVAGLFFSIAALFKIPAAFDVPAIVFLWLTKSKFTKKELVKLIKNTSILTLGFVTPIVFTFIWYAVKGALHEYWVAAFLQNVGYLSSWRSSGVQKPFIVRNAPLLIRALVVTLGGVILFIKRKKLSRNFIFITFWLLLTLFAVTLSERPYPHYLIQSVAPASLLLGLMFTGKTIEQVLTIIPLSIAFFVPVYFNFWYYPTPPYFVRFLNLVTGKVSKQAYLNAFGGNTVRNYQIASYIDLATSPNDKIFVWGGNTTIYALSKRLPPIKYVADYHIEDFSSTDIVLKQLAINMPQLIVILPNSPDFAGLNVLISDNYFEIEDISGAKIYKLFNAKIRNYIAQ